MSTFTGQEGGYCSLDGRFVFVRGQQVHLGAPNKGPFSSVKPQVRGHPSLKVMHLFIALFSGASAY